MSDLRELYQEVIIDHSRRPQNFCVCQDASHIKEGFNPLCGDKITVYLTQKNGVVDNITFQGAGCAISTASASLMTEVIKGKTIIDAKMLFADFHLMMTQGMTNELSEKMGKLAVLAGVLAYPMRVKCATLAWHTLMSAINDDSDV